MNCAHEPCACPVDDGEYCGPECHAMATDRATAVPVDTGTGLPMTDCGCGHPRCAAA